MSAPPSAKGSVEEEEDTVTVTVTVAVACTKVNDDQSRLIEELIKRNKRMLEAPKAQRYFHCEYTVAPENECTVSDVVSFGIAAKVYTENDSKVVKTWDDGPSTWVAWSQPHQFRLTEENVDDIYNHTMEFKLWDSKDKVSAKARFDRPKAFRLPSTKDGTAGRGVAAVVAKQSRSWTGLQPQDSTPRVHVNSLIAQFRKDPDTPVTPPIAPTPPRTRRRTSLGKLAGLDIDKKDPNNAKWQMGGAKDQKQHEAAFGEQTEGTATADVAKKPHPESSKVKMITIPIKMELLFSGLKEVTSRLSEPTLNINDMFVSVSVSGSLMPESLRRKLNPLVIQIKSVKDLPSTPVPRNILSSICEPVHCCYKFLDNPSHRTSNRPHSDNVYFQDTHIILAGKLSPGRLFEYLQRKGLIVEVHDRDQKLPEDGRAPLIFGGDSEDRRIATIGSVSAKKTTQNAFRDRRNDLNRFGVAEVFLNDLLRGRLNLNFTVSVRPSNNSNIVEVMEQPDFPSILPGDYHHAGTILKIKVSLSYPLTNDPTIPSELPLNGESCPFGRVVCYFDFENKELVQYLEDYITKANMKSLKLDQFDKHVAEAALSTYKLTYKQKASTDLDILTGFHVMDGEFHMFILEGLRNGLIVQLCDEISKMPRRVGFVRLLYDTSLSFNSRLYSELDVNISAIKLHQPLRRILEQPLLYVRDLVPRLCFECLTLIRGITEVFHLRDICRNDLFPSYETVLSMSREFGVPITHSDYESHHSAMRHDAEQEIHPEPAEHENDTMIVMPHKEESKAEDSDVEHGKEMNRASEKSLDSQKPVNFVLRNIISAQEAGTRKRPLESKIYGIVDGKTHNYSTQTLSSAELAKNVLRSVLYDTDKTSRYAYNSEYNSAMVPISEEDEFYRQEEDQIKRGWRTEDGFTFPGVRSSMLSNVHPARPDRARIDELKLKWRENTLHSHRLKPTLNRDIWSWDLRNRDMNLYKRPEDEARTESVHLPGQKRQSEISEHRRRLKEDWKSKIIVDDITMRFHRVSCNTEQTNASNQIDKLRSVLKDDPKKYALKFQSALSIPPLSVVTHTGADDQRKARKRGRNVGLQPGPYDGLSWKFDKNTIPIADMDHDKFRGLRGSDFSAFLNEHEYLAKKPIQPLTKKERENELFKTILPPVAPKKKPPQVTEREEEPVENNKSEYKERFVEVEPTKRDPILPRHQFVRPSDIPSYKDASLELVGRWNGMKNRKYLNLPESVSVE